MCTLVQRLHTGCCRLALALAMGTAMETAMGTATALEMARGQETAVPSQHKHRGHPNCTATTSELPGHTAGNGHQ